MWCSINTDDTNNLSAKQYWSKYRYHNGISSSYCHHPCPGHDYCSANNKKAKEIKVMTVLFKNAVL